jgi:hypothetical protein
VKLDGAELGQASLGIRIPVDPGEHTLLIDSASGHRSMSIKAETGEANRVELDLSAPGAPSPQPGTAVPSKKMKGKGAAGSGVNHAATPRSSQATRKSTLRAAGYVVGAVGAASLVGAGVLTGIALGQRGIVEDHCPGRVCDPEGFQAAETGASLLRLADVGLIVGIAGLACAGVLFWQSDKAEIRAGASGSGVFATARMVLP